MEGKIKVELGNVQKTLLLPLWGRAKETQKNKPMLIDSLSVEIVDRIDYDFSKIEEGLDEISRIGWIARCVHIDRTIREFLEKRSNATVVNIGCGLDTTFWRVDNGTLHWYDLDLPDVIGLRSKLIPDNERISRISGSVFDAKWLSEISAAENVLFISAGVLYYFEQPQIMDLFLMLADKYPDSEIIFDATSPFGVKMANRMVIRKSGMDEKSFLKWGLKNARELEKWDRRIKVLEEYPYFSHFDMQSVGISTRIKAWVFNFTKASYMIHLRFEKS
jgi:O-methyltransferase involved in polyketide biosynthesis